MQLSIVSINHMNESTVVIDRSRFDKTSTAALRNSCNSLMSAPASCEVSRPKHPFARRTDSLLQHMSKVLIPDIKQDPFMARSPGLSRNFLANPELFMIETDQCHERTPDEIPTYSTNFSKASSNTLDMTFPAHAFEPTPIGPSVRLSSPVCSSDKTRFELVDWALSAIIEDRSEQGSNDPHQDISVPLHTPSSHTPQDLGESTCSGTPMKVNKRTLDSSGATADASPKKRSRSNASSEKTPLYRPYQETQWSENFQDLLKFREHNGHCLVQHTSKGSSSLSRWVKRQRYQYKLKQEKKVSALSDERVQLLDKIGFVWDTHAVVWEEHRLQLEQYKQEHGDCNVPSQFPENPKLSTWVKCQRRQYRKFCKGEGSSMTLERFGKLEKMGFAWQLRGLKNTDAFGFDL